MFRLLALAVIWAVFPVPASSQNRTIIEYWDKWTGMEGASMENAVEAFNRSQDRITVRYSAISQIDLKLMLAVAGRRPPDVAGLWTHTLPVYVENNALLPLDKLARKHKIQQDSYIPSIWKLCVYRDHLWALPSTPSSLALHWNKGLFREAGLDPEHPPQTIEELEQFNLKLTRFDNDGTVMLFGHLPEEPGWWRSLWGYWFGGELVDRNGLVSVSSEGNRRAFEWVQSYPKRFGVSQCGAFLEGFGNFASPLNPFIQSKVAMELQGPWMWNFIRKYGKDDFELGVGPFPSSVAGSVPVTIVESDILVIPAGATHVEEAFEFITFINKQEILEELCAAQFKFTPLAAVSDAFWKTHPHPFARVFYDLACSPGARSVPQIPNWNQYKVELDQAAKEVWAMRADPDAALSEVQATIQKDLTRRQERWTRLAERLNVEWESDRRN